MNASPTHQRLCPTSYPQERLWFLDQLDPGTSTYNVARVIKIRGPLSVHALRDSLQEIVARHQALRTTFADIDGTPMQVIVAAGSFDLPLVELSAAPDREREAQALRLARDEAQ